MIYVLVGTQVMTMIVFAFIISWVIEDKNNTNEVIGQLARRSEERVERMTLKQLENEHVHAQSMEKLFEMMAEKAFIEREQLLNRIQAPEVAIAATPAAMPGGVSVEDDEEVEPLDVPDRIPMDDLMVRPQTPMPPMEPFLADNDEEDDV